MNKTPNNSLLSLLAECAAACYHCANSCLGEKDVQMMTACIKLDMDCAQICTTAAGFVSRGSAHASHILKECAEICTQCAQECEKHTHMEHCRHCAEICRRCAEACLK